MDKMLVSPDGDVIITNDGATILEKMEVCKLNQCLFIKPTSHDEDSFEYENIFGLLY
jgi:chaperonin GroEL (HSP60 family)